MEFREVLRRRTVRHDTDRPLAHEAASCERCAWPDEAAAGVEERPVLHRGHP